MNRAGFNSAELIRACIEGKDLAAWEEFVHRYRPLIAAVVSRTARRFGDASPQIVDDLVQETFLKLCAGNCHVLRDFVPRSEESIFGLLKSVAFSVVHDHFRGVLAAMRGGGRKDTVLDAYIENTVPATGGMPQVEREILLHEIGAVLEDPAGGASVRDREIFWLYYRHGLTARAIASMTSLGLTQKGVESVIQRLTSFVRQRLAGKEREDTEGKSPAGAL